MASTSMPANGIPDLNDAPAPRKKTGLISFVNSAATASALSGGHWCSTLMSRLARRLRAVVGQL